MRNNEGRAKHYQMPSRQGLPVPLAHVVNIDRGSYYRKSDATEAILYLICVETNLERSRFPCAV
jgi:hypothetical protein